MEAQPKLDLLDEIRTVHQELERRASGSGWESVDAVLNLGAAVLLHGLLERLIIHPNHVLLDPAVIQDLNTEHRRLTRHLQTLEELRHSDPTSPDLPPLAEAVFHRLKEHLQRDARTIYGPLTRLELARSERLRDDPAF